MTADNSTRDLSEPDLSEKSALVVGVGGLGCPAALILCRAGFGRVVLLDEDEVDETNLHRQILYHDEQIGTPKLVAAQATLVRDGTAPERIECRPGRLLPDNARELVRGVDVVIEGSDNYATKFLAADACYLESKPVVHGSALGWRATVMAVGKAGGPCYRCLFEDLPSGANQPSCATAGVLGPIVGIAGAWLAEWAVRLASGEPATGQVLSYDGYTDRFRIREVGPRRGCALCGPRPTILDTPIQRYLGEICAA